MKRIQVIGHRGLPALYPENTLPSFRAAVDTGVDAVELDIHLTKDGKLVVTHDEKIDRCSNGKGFVRDHLFKDLLGLDFGSWKGEAFANTRIPTLDEALDVIFQKRPSIFILLEIKANDEQCARMVLEVIRSREMFSNSLVVSFHNRILRLLRELQPDIFLQGFPDRYVKEPTNGDYRVINKTCIWTREITAEEVGYFKEQKIQVDTCAVDDEVAINKVMALDIDSFTTNAAHIVIPLLKAKGMR